MSVIQYLLIQYHRTLSVNSVSTSKTFSLNYNSDPGGRVFSFFLIFEMKDITEIGIKEY